MQTGSKGSVAGRDDSIGQNGRLVQGHQYCSTSGCSTYFYACTDTRSADDHDAFIYWTKQDFGAI